MNALAPSSIRWATAVATLMLLLGFALSFAQPAGGAGRAYVLTVADAIGAATGDYIVRGIEQAEADGAELVVLRLDTPGGLVSTTRDIVGAMLNARVPVVVWVTPAGARAASAGTYMLYGAHVAAMSPSTTLGAATPVQLGGGGSAPASPAERLRDLVDDGSSDDGAGDPEAEAAPAQAEDQNTPAPSGDAAGRKAINDAVAWIRSLAERHGRNADWAEQAVREAVSLTAREALEQNVIDVIAADLAQLLAAIDGREVRMNDGLRVLATAELEPFEIEPDWRTRLLSIVTNPTLAYILLMVGIYGLILEGYNPGALVPGVIGGICLLVALYALQVLPVNYAGLALIALGLALIAVELFVPSFGILGIGGIVAVVFGSVLLFDTGVPGLGVNRGVIGGMGLIAALTFGIVMRVAMRSLGKPRPAVAHELDGDLAEALVDFRDGRGRVHLHGEDWRAHCERPVRAGERVRVLRMHPEGFVLEVEPASESGAESELNPSTS
ncbi:MAG: nodulation protein NfeD [Wenzhouxiangellaceae bacterium]|nr:nodulation protein NfeD [Wenzhouxiangellaceae bacterium]